VVQWLNQGELILKDLLLLILHNQWLQVEMPIKYNQEVINLQYNLNDL
jgi:hypothetical protein